MPDTTPEAPSIPHLPPPDKLRVFVIGGLWVVMLTLAPVAETLYEWLTDPVDRSISWKQLLRLAMACAGPSALAYWRKYVAWLKAPPGTELVKTTTTQTAMGATQDEVVTVKTETVDLQQKVPVVIPPTEPKP